MNWLVAYHCLFHVGLHLERQPTRTDLDTINRKPDSSWETACCLPLPLSCWRGSLLPTTTSFMLERQPVAYHYLFHVGEAACCLPLPLSCWRGSLLPTTTSFMLERQPVAYHYLFHERQPTGRRDLDRINQKSDFFTLKYRYRYTSKNLIKKVYTEKLRVF